MVQQRTSEIKTLMRRTAQDIVEIGLKLVEVNDRLEHGLFLSMIKEVLDVTHEMGFAREVADRLVFFDEGQIVEQAPPLEFFDNPREERIKLFLSQILTH